jgi:hypothetical protein
MKSLFNAKVLEFPLHGRRFLGVMASAGYALAGFTASAEYPAGMKMDPYMIPSCFSPLLKSLIPLSWMILPEPLVGREVL